MGDDEADSSGGKVSVAPDPLLAAIGARVRDVRNAKELGVTATATAAGIGKGHLWRVEAGQQNYSVRVLARIAAALEVDLSELVKSAEVRAAIKGMRESSPALKAKRPGRARPAKAE